MGNSVEAASIILREGLEALLVIAAIGAYLSRIGAADRLRALLQGAGAGVLASFATAWAFAAFNDGAHDDLLEGIVMLVAAGLLLYVSGWLFVRQDPRAWTAYLQGQVERAQAAGSAAALAGVGFLAVYREGAETVLFLQALSQQGGWGLDLFAGIAAGAAILIVGFLAVRRFAIRVPLRPLFIGTSALLFVMALRFIAGAVQELQEQTLLPQDYADIPDWLADLAGNSTWEALGPQLALIAIAAAGIVWTLRRPATPAK